MAQLAPIAMIAAAAISAGGTIAAGNSAKESADYQARQLRQRAKAADATAQAKAEQDRRQLAIVQSRVQALAASSGAGATDKTVLDIMGRNTKEGEYAALADLWTGNEQAAYYNQSADVARTEGANAQQQSRIAAVGSLFEGMGKAYGAGANTGPDTTPQNVPSLNTGVADGESMWQKYGLKYQGQWS